MKTMNSANEASGAGGVPVVEARGLTKTYGTTRALDKINLSIGAGRIVGLIGPNGAGKTTTLKSILGLAPYEGELRVLGLNPYSERARLMQDVCFIADVAVMPRWLKVSDAIDFVSGIHPRFNRARADAFLSKTEIPRNARVKQLSKGMVTQLHLALVMAIEARLLVLDEPTLGLDIIYRKRFYDTLLNDYFSNEDSLEQARTIIVTTHQVEEIENILTDVIFIGHGRVVLDLPMDSIADRFTQLSISSERLAEARALGPIHEHESIGRSLLYFENVDRKRLAALGDVRTPGLADLFVAKLSGSAGA
jgi:ABC-2 type transport system ATP-binding protein